MDIPGVQATSGSCCFNADRPPTPYPHPSPAQIPAYHLPSDVWNEPSFSIFHLPERGIAIEYTSAPWIICPLAKHLAHFLTPGEMALSEELCLLRGQNRHSSSQVHNACFAFSLQSPLSRAEVKVWTKSDNYKSTFQCGCHLASIKSRSASGMLYKLKRKKKKTRNTLIAVKRKCYILTMPHKLKLNNYSFFFFLFLATCLISVKLSWF